MTVMTFQSKIDYTNYYRNALLYLACLPEPSPLSPVESQTRAYNLSIAALLAEKIYNFGELLLHPILNELNNTPNAWLSKLLFSMNSGDLDAFNKLSPQLSSIVIPLYILLIVSSLFLQAMHPCYKRKSFYQLCSQLYSPDHRIVEHCHFNSLHKKRDSQSMKLNILL